MDLAERLRAVAQEAGLEGQELAARCGWHPSKVSRLSTATRQPTEADIRAWCEACDAEDRTYELVTALHAMYDAWRTWRRMEHAGLNQGARERLQLHQRTRHLRSYGAGVLPPLLQTRRYAAEVLRPDRQLRARGGEATDTVKARLDRQRLLRQEQREFAFLIEEPVLRNTLSTPEVQAEQLQHLLTLTTWPHITIGIIPAAPSRVHLPVENFQIHDHAQVNVGLVSGQLTLTQPSDIDAYLDTYTDLTTMATHGGQARALIDTARNALTPQ